jgi:lipopolysaccharide export LptBFGC system permease protein LptF
MPAAAAEVSESARCRPALTSRLQAREIETRVDRDLHRRSFTKHQFWSRLIYAGFAMALFVAPFAFRRRGYSSIALIAVAVIGYCSILASLIFGAAHWLEWPSVGLILAFVCLLGAMSVSRSSAGLPESEPRRPRAARKALS